jgi:hypothetical protein
MQSKINRNDSASNKFSLIPLSEIDIVERPAEGEENEKLFFNPRGPSSFTPDRMMQLQYSIRTDGIQQPPIVRLNEDSYQLIAGERRIRSCQSIVENDLPCFDEDNPRRDSYDKGDVVLYKGRFGTVIKELSDEIIVDFNDDCVGSQERKNCPIEDVFATVSGSELYENVPCKIVTDCSDQRALRLAFTENDQSEPLTIAEEVALVERLSRSGLKQEEIAELLGSNITWVCQTGNFRSQLPNKAFDKLIKGEMTRHVAVNFLSYSPDDREELFEATLEAETQETQEKISELTEEKERFEDEEEIAISDAIKADDDGDEKTARKLRKKAAGLASKATKAAGRLERVKRDKGNIKQGHVKSGAKAKGLQPKKIKSLDKNDIETIFVDGIQEFLEGEGVCEITGESVPAEYAAIVLSTAKAIIAGISDPIHPIREYMCEIGVWELPKRKKKNKEEVSFDEDAIEEDETISEDDDFENHLKSYDDDEDEQIDDE